MTIEEELKLTEELWEACREVIRLIPECPVHGECLPHARAWIEERKKEMRLKEREVIDTKEGGYA